MAAPKLVFKIKGIPQTGEFIQFTVGGQAYTITVVDSTTQGVGEVRNVTGTGKKQTSSLQFAQSLQKAFIGLNIPGYTSIIRDNSIVEYYSLDDGASFNFSAVTDSASIDLIQQIDSGVAIPNPSVSNDQLFNISIQHETKEYYPAEPREFLYGNAGDLVTTTIDFSTEVALSYINFNYNLVENDVDPYPSDDDYTISDDFWSSSYTDTLISFTGGVGVLSIGTPRQGVSGSAELFDLGGNNYRIIHEHILQPIVRLGDTTVNNVVIPEQFNGTNAVKYIFKIEGRSDLINPEPDVSTNNVNLSNYFKNGNTGFVNEFLNVGNPNYELQGSFTFDTGDGEIDKNQDSQTNTFILKNNVGSWLTTADLIIYVQEIKDTFEQSQTLEQNLNIERLSFNADAVPVSGTNILNATATIDADTTLVNVSFQIANNTINGDYVLWIAASNDSANVNHNNIFLQRGIAGLAADETTVQFGTYTDAPRADFNFNYHYNNDINNSFNQVKSFIEDRLANRFRIVSDASNELVKFTLGVKRTSTGEIFESFDVFASSLDFETNRSFKLESTDIKNQIEVRVVDPITYDFEYGFQIWKEWVDYTDVVFFAACTFIQTTNGGDEIQFTKEFWSPNFDLANYDITKNTALEPQALRSPGSIQFYDEDTLTEVKGLIKNRDTRVTATFQDDNLNDLQLDEADMTGYISVNAIGDNQNTYEMFHSTVSNGSLRPFEQITGEASFLAKITKIDVKTAKIEAVILYDKLKALFPDSEVFDVTARLDKLQAQLVCLLFQTNFNPATDGTFDPSVTHTGADDFEWNFEDGSKLLGASISTTGNGLDGTVQNVSLCTEDLSKIESFAVQNDKIVGILDVSTLVNSFSFAAENNEITDFVIGAGVDIINFRISDNPNLNTVLDFSQRNFVNCNELRFNNSAITGIIFSSGANSQVGSGLTVSDTNISTLDLSTFTQIEVFSAANCSLLTSITNFTSALDCNVYYAYNCDLSTLDISGISGLGGDFRVYNNPNLTVITNPVSSEVFSIYWAFQCDLTGVLDVSGLTGLAGNFSVYINPNLTSINLPVSSGVFNTFQVYSCDLTGTLDMSSLTGLGGNIRGYSNPNLTTLINPISSETINTYWFSDCGLSGVLDLSTLTGLGGFVALSNNSITSISNPVSTVLITQYGVQQNNLTGNLDVSTLNLTGNFLTYTNPNLTSITLPTNTNTLTQLWAYGCDLSTINITSMSNMTDINNGNYRFDDNNMTTGEVDTILADLDSISSGGFTGRSINISGTNAAPTGGAANPNVLSLQAKLFVVTIT